MRKKSESDGEKKNIRRQKKTLEDIAHNRKLYATFAIPRKIPAHIMWLAGHACSVLRFFDVFCFAAADACANAQTQSKHRAHSDMRSQITCVLS